MVSARAMARLVRVARARVVRVRVVGARVVRARVRVTLTCSG